MNELELEEIIEDIERLFLDRPNAKNIISSCTPSGIVLEGIGSISIKKTRSWGAYVIAVKKHYTKSKRGLYKNKYIIASRATNIEIRTKNPIKITGGYYGSEKGLPADVELRLEFSEPCKVHICNPDARCYIELS